MAGAGDGDGATTSSSPPREKRKEEGEEAVAPGGKEKREVPEPPPEEALPPRKMRLPRACNSKPKPPPPPPPEQPRRRAAAGGAGPDEPPQCRVVMPLVSEPDASAELPRWRLRCMWELASVLNFLHVFWPLLNITGEFTAEDLEEALITPNSTLDDVHMPLLKSIPPVTRMAMGRGTWVTVLCRKLKDWWHWVAEGDLPIVASHGAEIETYKVLEPATRLVILKAICDIRVEQEDIRSFIDSSLKHGYDLSTFRKERIGGDPYGISYWYEDDPILGHRLYREIRRVEQAKKEPGKRSRGKRSSTPVVSYQWETVASNFDEFDDVAEKLFSSRNRSEANLGKKLKIEYLPDIEKIHKKRERLHKKQQREALLIDSYLATDGFTTGRSLRDRKPVTYTFDEYDRSINEAIKITKKSENSAEPIATSNRRILTPKPEASSNGKVNGLSPTTNEYEGDSSKSDDYRDSDGEQESETLDRSNRRRRRSQRYTRDFVEVVSDIDPNFDSDDEIMGEAVYDDDYLRTRKPQKASSASEEDEEFQLEDAEDDAEEEEEYSLSSSEDLEEPQRHKKLQTCGRRGARLRSVDEIQTGLRRSKRSSRQHINYEQYDFSDTDTEAGTAEKSDASDPDAGFDAENDMELSTSSQEQEEEEDDGHEEQKGNSDDNKMDEDHAIVANKEEQEEQPHPLPQLPQQPMEKMDVPSREIESVGRTFLDLNELAPGCSFDDGPSLTMKDEDMDNS
ncbi:hypothetical protein GUJ93_ZPchr0007g5311 [Zizania palustris]|uniref:DDT domain-containing protein n=1 Tax=Zizania palustris TaxID=103762 RepID=A0A8J5TDU0_ZIZPA|nr:hypothetical protein GUJ93_ZPchr0007g5311 [Zizania palustris]